MPSPIPAIPKTHDVTVNLGKVLTNMQRAINTLFAKGVALPPGAPAAPSEESAATCKISTLDELRHHLQPAAHSKGARYEQLWQENTRYIRLTYVDSNRALQRVLVSPMEISFSHTNTTCALHPGLATYFAAALDIAPPAPVKSAAEASMIGCLRCFAATSGNCDNYMDYAPAVQTPLPDIIAKPEKIYPEIEEIEKYLNLSRKAPTGKLMYRYFGKVIDLLRKTAEQFDGSHDREIIKLRDRIKEQANHLAVNHCLVFEEGATLGMNWTCGNATLQPLVTSAHSMLRLNDKREAHLSDASK